MNNQNHQTNSLGDVIAYSVLVFLALLTIAVGAWQINRNSLSLQEEKTVFAMQSRLQGYFVNQLTQYKQIKFEDQGLFRNLPRRDELVNLVTFLELIDQKTGNLGTIRVAESVVPQNGYPFPSVLYTIELKGSLSSFSDYLSYLETLPYYYIVQRATWQDVQVDSASPGTRSEPNQGQIDLVVFMKNSKI